jgi:hypothetical protein
MDVKVTVTIGSRTLPIEKVSDPRITAPMMKLARDVASRLESITCPEHGKTATNVRIRFDRKGAADLSYDSCCAALGARIGEQLG